MQTFSKQFTPILSYPRYRHLVFALVTLLYLLYANSFSATGVEPSYRLGPGDHIQIRIFNEPDLDLDVKLDSTGVISYPFLGDLAIDGLSVSDVEDLIIDGLKGPYLVNPVVNITVIQYRQFYIYGEVKQPGEYQFQPGLTLRKAVALAGGFTDRASTSRIMIIRENNPGQAEEKMALDDPVNPGDVVNVNQSFF